MLPTLLRKIASLYLFYCLSIVAALHRDRSFVLGCLICFPLQLLLLLLGRAVDASPRLDYSYTSNPAANVMGGIKSWATYVDNHLFGYELPLNGFLGNQKSSLGVSFLARSGQSLSATAIGNQFTVQQVYGGQSFIYYALNAKLKLDDMGSSIRFGRMAAGDIFATDPIYWLYMNNAIDGNPQSIVVNSGFSAYPAAKWGAAVTAHLGNGFSAKLGGYQIADIDVTQTHGFDWSISPDDGLFLIAQLDLKRSSDLRHDDISIVCSADKNSTDIHGKSLASDPSGNPESTPPLIEAPRGREKQLSTTAFLGGFLSLRPQEGFGNIPGRNSVAGLYAHVDRQLSSESCDPTQGLTAWSSVAITPQPSVAKIPLQVNGGIVYTGLIPSRDKDLSMVGLFSGNFSRDYLATLPSSRLNSGSIPGSEVVVEIGHRIYASESLYLQPNVQLVVNPGGLSDPPALVAGAQIGLRF
jgi:porin